MTLRIVIDDATPARGGTAPVALTRVGELALHLALVARVLREHPEAQAPDAWRQVTLSIDAALVAERAARR